MIKHILKLLWNKKGSNVLMLLEIFLSFLVLFAVLLFVIINLYKFNTPIGFDTKDKWIVSYFYSNDSTTVADNNQILYNSLKEMDNVEGIAFGNGTFPFSGNTSMTTSDDMGFEVYFKILRTDENYAEVMNIKPIQGRWFEEDDLLSKYPPIVVTEDYIDLFFEGKNMIDSIGYSSGQETQYKIIGVIPEYKYEGEFAEPYPKIFFYQPKTDVNTTTIYLDMKEGTPIVYQEKINELLFSVTKSNNVLIQNLDNLRERQSMETWIPIIALLIICGFLCLNVGLGLFGVLWYSIQRRKGEIGLRQAIGAYKGAITRQFLMEIFLLTGIGIGIGVFFVIQLPLLKVFPIENKFYYYALLASVSFMLLLVLVCAIYPSNQAAKINPAIALHEE